MNIAVSQALAAGLPVIATRHSGFPEQVHDGVHGFLVNEGDVQALAEKIVYMIEHPELWHEMGVRGREHVQRHYDVDTAIERQVEVYERLVNG